MRPPAFSPDLFVPPYLGETSAQHAERLLDAIISDLAKGP